MNYVYLVSKGTVKNQNIEMLDSSFDTKEENIQKNLM